MSIDTTARNLMEAMQGKQQPSAYDSQATVTRVDGDTLWVHIPGGVDETPIQRTIDASEGDVVQVRISNGNAFAIGNASAPPTDDKRANQAYARADNAAEMAAQAVESAQEAGASLVVMRDQIRSVVTALDEKNTTYSAAQTAGYVRLCTKDGDPICTTAGDPILAKIKAPDGVDTTGLTVGDLWYNTSENNTVYRWNGSIWEPVADPRISEISQKLDSITLRVVGSDGVASEIKLNDQGQINLLGSVIAERLNVDELFARDITATGQFWVNNPEWQVLAGDNGTVISSSRGISLSGRNVYVDASQDRNPDGYSANNIDVYSYGGQISIMVESPTYQGKTYGIAIPAPADETSGSTMVVPVRNLSLIPYGNPSLQTLGTDGLAWGEVWADHVYIDGFEPVVKQNKTISGTTTAAGNLSLGLSDSYGILSVHRTDANGICTPYVYNGTSNIWYAHITNIAASPAAVTNTSVTLEVDYYAK